MSLTSFLKVPDVRERLRVEFTVPPFAMGSTLLQPPVTKNYSCVGAAFDYLLRFYAERLNPGCFTGKWAAEEAAICDIEFEDCSVSLPGIFEKAKSAYTEYIKTGVINEKLLRETIC